MTLARTLGCTLLLTAATSVAQDVETTPVVEVAPATAAPATPAVETAPVIEADAAVPNQSNVINLAICLDTSGSMEGLIDAARQKIWDIVNELALAEPSPDLHVALLTYGNQGHDAENGWVFVQTDFTKDLDLVSERLFALTTNGGDEYVGRVLNAATKQLSWHPSTDALKLVIVAGNESADQDPVIPFRDACRNAISNGVMVNSIYCGNPADDIAPGWREVALLADGKFASIDHNEGTIVIATPFDDDLARLSTALNGTYIPYTPEGESAWVNQTVQDNNAANLNGAANASRVLTKCSSAYVCSWDLVTKCQQDENFDLTSLETKQLPEAMQKMTPEEMQAHIKTRAVERSKIETEMQAIGQKRQAFIEAEMKKTDATRSFDFVVRQAIREQARSRGFAFAEPEPVAVEPAEAGGPEAPSDAVMGPPTPAQLEAGQKAMQQVVNGDGC